MSPSPESPEFEKLRILLRLKRFEQPPPGYFNRFSACVMERIETEGSEELAGWWQRFLFRFDAQPVLACAYSVAIGGLLVVGMGLSQALGREQISSLPAHGSWLATIPSPISGQLIEPSSVEVEPSSFSAAYRQTRSSSMEPVWNSGAPSFLVGGGRFLESPGSGVERAGFRLQGQ